MNKVRVILLLSFFVQQAQGMSFIAATILTKAYAQPKLQEQPKPYRQSKPQTSYITPKECEHIISFKQTVEELTKENMTTEDMQIIEENFQLFAKKITRKNIESGTRQGLKATTVLTFGNTISHTQTHGVLIFNNITTDSSAYVCLLSVKKESQKKGIGTKLLNFLETYPHISRIHLLSTPTAISFYEKNGFISNEPFSLSNVFMEKNVKK